MRSNWDMHGPAGPTGFWKISDDMDARRGKNGEPIGVEANGHESFSNDDDSDSEGQVPGIL